MSKKIKLELDRFPKELETAVNSRFPGAGCLCYLEFFVERGYAIEYAKDHEKAPEIDAFIRGAIWANEELRARVYKVLPE